MTNPGLPGLPPPSDPLTHVPPLETPECSKPISLFPGPQPHAYPLSDNFRHSGWAPQRAKIRDALVTLFVRDSRMSNFLTCGSSYWILRHKTDASHFKIVPDFCHDRFCVPCAAQRAALIRSNLASRLTNQRRRFLTLTVRSTGEPLAVLLDRLYAGFRRLRQRSLWKDRVTGGVAFVEVTHNPDGGGWHPHIHCILDGRYIDRPHLSKIWLSCTGDSTHLHLSEIRDTAQALRYVTKYATKAVSPTVIRHPHLLVEAVQSLASRRLVITFGTWRLWKLLTDPDDKHWEVYCHANELQYTDYGDDTLKTNVAAMFKTADPHSGEFFATATEDP